MLRLLIVDDHPDQVESMAQTIPWHRYGVEMVYKSYSAYEALEYIHSQRVDILITDIRMPGMNGLELIQHARAVSQKMKCVVLSGFGDFEYAKQAIQYKTAGYLMKPVDTQELISLIEQIRDDLQQEWNVNEVYQNALYTLRENIPFLRAKMLMDLIQGKPASRSVICKKMKTLELPLNCDDYVCMMVIRPDEEISHEDEDNLSPIEYAITNMAEEVFRDTFNLWHCKDANGQLVFVVSANSGQPDKPAEGPVKERYRRQLEAYVELLQKKTRIYLKRKISALLVNRWSLLPEISSMYQTAVTSIRQHVGQEKEWFVIVTEDEESEQTGSLQSLYEPPLLLHLLETGSWDMADERLRLIFAELSVKWRESPEHLSEAFFFITGAFMRVSHKNGRQLQAIIGDCGKKLHHNCPFYTLDQLHNWVFQVFRMLRDDLQRDCGEAQMTVVERIQAYIGEHVNGDASLQAIADHVGLHPAYISKVYKVETGTGISDYVMKVKMEKAVELLRSKNEKIYNVASQLGYHTPHYFIKVFKKYYGVTPQEFKQSQ